MPIKTDIVIIDSGISEENVEGISFIENDGGIVQSFDLTDVIGHGTGIYHIIKRHSRDSSVFFIKICVKRTKSLVSIF